MEPTRFFKFPDQKKDEQRFLKWREFCGGSLSCTTILIICSMHFERSAYNKKDIMLNIPFDKCHLSDDAIPTRFNPNTTIAPSKRESMLIGRKRKATVNNLIHEHIAEKQRKLVIYNEKFTSASTQTT